MSCGSGMTPSLALARLEDLLTNAIPLNLSHSEMYINLLQLTLVEGLFYHFFTYIHVLFPINVFKRYYLVVLLEVFRYSSFKSI